MEEAGDNQDGGREGGRVELIISNSNFFYSKWKREGGSDNFEFVFS